jgi:hypothetical protein
LTLFLLHKVFVIFLETTQWETYFFVNSFSCLFFFIFLFSFVTKRITYLAS